MGYNRIAVIAVLILCILCSACSPSATSANLPPQATSPNLPTHAAPQENLVDLVHQGTLTYRLTSGSINQLGLNLRNTGSQPVQVVIPSGTFFVNADPQSQNMVVLHSASVPSNRVSRSISYWTLPAPTFI